MNSSSTQIVLITDGRANKGCGSIEDISHSLKSIQEKIDMTYKARKFYENLGSMARLCDTTINIISFSDS